MNPLYLKNIILVQIQMKKINFLPIIGILTLLFLFSCDNEPVDSTVNLNPVTPSLPVSFKVSFSGQTYTTSLHDCPNEHRIQINPVSGSRHIPCDNNSSSVFSAEATATVHMLAINTAIQNFIFITILEVLKSFSAAVISEELKLKETIQQMKM